MLTSGAYRGFAAIGDQWRRIMAACQDRRDTGIQIEKSETHIGDQIRSSRDNYFWRKSEPNAKRQKLRNETAMNTESQKPNFFGTKTDIKNTKKSQCPGPSRMNRTVQSTNHTNDNTKTIIIAETSTKTFFKIFLVFQSETCCETTLVTRYFFKEGVMSRNRIIHRLRISMLDTL